MVLRERSRPALPGNDILPTTNNANAEQHSSLSNDTFVNSPFSHVIHISSGSRPSSSRIKALLVSLIGGACLMGMLFKMEILSWGEAITNASHVKPILFAHFHKSGGAGACKTLLNSTFIVVTDAEGLFQDPELNCHTALSGPKQSPEQFYRMQTCRHHSGC